MEKIYDLRRHTHYVTVHIGNSFVYIEICQASNRNLQLKTVSTIERACITYDKKKVNITSFGDASFEKEDKEGVQINNFSNGLYLVFRKNKDTWNENDKLLIKAVSDFLNLAVKKAMERSGIEHKNFDIFHYAVAVPSEWEEEIKEDLIRYIFTQASLISKGDHRDRILVSTDIESICYGLHDGYSSKYVFKRVQNIIMCRRAPIDGDTALIKLDLVTTANALFDFANSMLFPRVIYSNSISITVNGIRNCIKGFLKDNLFSKSESNPQIIETLVNEIYSSVDNSWDLFGDGGGGEDEDNLMTPIYINTDRWKLNDAQKTFLDSIRPFDICAIVGKPLSDNMKDIILSNLARKYELLSVEDNYTTDVDLNPVLTIWLKYILEWNMQQLNEKTSVTTIDLYSDSIRRSTISTGLRELVGETIQNAEMYGFPQINSMDYSNTSSWFLNSKPDIIINIDISLNSTLLACSLLNGNPATQNKFDHSYFTAEKSLPSLQNFYNISSVTSLTVTESFIPFAEKHFLSDPKKLFSSNADFLSEIELIFNKTHPIKNKSTTTQQKKYLKAFLLVYLIYIKEIISGRLSMHVKIDNTNIKVGFAISIEKILLDSIAGSKEDLQDLIYTSGLIKEDDTSKKLRIITQGEGMLPSIKKCYKISLPLKSYFILSQIHEDYIRLTLNQVVTTPNSENQQEVIIIEDKTIYIENVYDSLCSYIWENLVQNRTLIQLCNTHRKVDNEEFFSLKTKTEIVKNLKQYILDNILAENSNRQTFYKNAIKINLSCNCKISLTTFDIIDIAFKPVLKDLNCTMLSTLNNQELFGRYKDIDYHFSLLSFNYNSDFQKVITNILEEEAIIFNPMRGIDTLCTAIPAFKVQPFSPKEFETGVLHQVYNADYAFQIRCHYNKYESDLSYKKKIADKQKIPVDRNIAHLFLEKGNILERNKVIETVYLYNSSELSRIASIDFYRYKTSGTTKPGKTFSKNDAWEQVYTSMFSIDPDNPRAIIIAAEYIGYTSSIKLSARPVSKNDVNITEMGEPMTLNVF